MPFAMPKEFAKIARAVGKALKEILKAEEPALPQHLRVLLSRLEGFESQSSIADKEQAPNAGSGSPMKVKGGR